MNTPEAYFHAERAGGMVFVLLGVVAIGVAVWSWRYGAFWRGAAWPLVLVALLQIGVGASVWWRSPQDLARVRQLVVSERLRVDSEEIPRVQQVVREFARNRWIEFALIAVGLLMAALAPRGTFWQGIAVGQVLQVGLVCFVDWFGERRAAAYLAWLQLP